MLPATETPRDFITVACLLRSGGDFDAEYVERLRDGVSRHLELEHRFVALSDVAVPCERIPLETDWPGWWSKLELFRALRSGRVIYFDLDVVITGPLDAIAARRFEFAMLRDFAHPSTFNSSAMAWSGNWSHVAELFTPSRAAEYQTAERWGDQGWIVEHLGQYPEALQDAFPGAFVSRKFGPRFGDAERVVCFHGRPRPRDVGWLTEVC